MFFVNKPTLGVFGVEWGQRGGAEGRRGNDDNGVYIFGGECMAARCEDSAMRDPSTINIFDVASTDFPRPRRAQIPRSSTTGIRKRTPSMGKYVEVAPTDFLTLHVARQFCTHSFVLTFSVGLKQYQFENHISSD
jgi:hypothetical protein